MSDLKLISCRKCGIIMVKLSRDICPKCFQAEEDLFLQVKEYLRANPNSSIFDVAIALDTTQDQIEIFINSGRLERTGVQISHQCQTCHRLIQIGLICQECSDDLKKQVGHLKKSMADDQRKQDDLFKKSIDGKKDDSSESLFKKKDDYSKKSRGDK